jgi:hypothetical protein
MMRKDTWQKRYTVRRGRGLPARADAPGTAEISSKLNYREYHDSLVRCRDTNAEKNSHNSLCLALVLLAACLSAGCISPSQKTTEKPLLLVAPEPTLVRNPLPQAAFGSQAGMTTAGLACGLIISSPVPWRNGETVTRVFRDYGRSVTNNANFYSPDILSDRASAAAPHPDTSAYTLLSIDADPAATSDFERYFNLATLAVPDAYKSARITKRNVQLKISVTDTFPGDTSY